MKKFSIYSIWFMLTLGFFLIGIIVSDISKYNYLVDHGLQTIAIVTKTEPHNHWTVYYTYNVNSQEYTGADSKGKVPVENLQIGNHIPIIYDPVKPWISTLDPQEHLLGLPIILMIITLFPTLTIVLNKKWLLRLLDKLTVKKKSLFLFVMLFVIYNLSYITIRKDAWIIHRYGYQTVSGSRIIVNHEINTGDVGVMGQRWYKIYASQIFKPLMWLENKFWYFIKPVGTAV